MHVTSFYVDLTVSHLSSSTMGGMAPEGLSWGKLGDTG